MSNLKTPFRYDFVGSFLRPEKLKKARRQFDEGSIDYAALKRSKMKLLQSLLQRLRSLDTM